LNHRRRREKNGVERAQQKKQFNRLPNDRLGEKKFSFRSEARKENEFLKKIKRGGEGNNEFSVKKKPNGGSGEGFAQERSEVWHLQGHLFPGGSSRCQQNGVCGKKILSRTQGVGKPSLRAGLREGGLYIFWWTPIEE